MLNKNITEYYNDGHNMVKVVLILVESALEIIPQEIRNNNIITSFCRRRRKRPDQTLLDQSYHHKAILKLDQHEKRGRPDIVHFCLLEAISVPLYFEGQFDVYVHTINDEIIDVGKDVRLPKVYDRFIGLIEKLFIEKKVSDRRRDLLRLSSGSLEDLLNRVRPSRVIGFSRLGRRSSLENVVSHALEFERPVFIVGGFAKGYFSEKNRALIKNIFAISKYPLEAHVVTARLLYEIEKQIGLEN
ncbi:MAG: ribosome biogenesis protein [Nitrososphaeria archaeon]